MDVDLFDFDLPRELIATHPASPRHDARMIRSIGGELSHHHIYDLPDMLREGDLLVVNNTKVLPSQLTAYKGQSEINLNLLEPLGLNSYTAFAKPGRKLQEGDALKVAGDVAAHITRKHDDGRVSVTFEHPYETLEEMLHAHGSMPLPPYISGKRATSEQDKQDYQTMFARREGAVAAPTAGLHFTPYLYDRLRESNVQIAEVTLHVGAGTFLPVKVEDTDKHVMHSERYEVEDGQARIIEQARMAGRRIIAVGTTSLRTLESVMARHGSITACSGSTDLFITPGYEFRIIDALLTNFHLPRSTLFMLIAAFVGLDKARNMYETAKQEGYRFYSYGDSCLLERGG